VAKIQTCKKGMSNAAVSIHGWKNQTRRRKLRKQRLLFTMLSQFSTLLVNSERMMMLTLAITALSNSARSKK
jgi:hypothetical protein